MANFKVPDPTKVLIVDTSKWQNDPDTPQNIDYVKMKSMGVEGVIMKAGQGDWVDRDFLVNWKNAKEAGLPRGAYWFYDNSYHPQKQAEAFLSLKLEEAELGVWLDLESRISGQYMGWKNWYNFLVRLQQSLPRKLIGIYTGYYYWTEFTTGSGISPASLSWFKQFPLWLAWYGNEPMIPTPWKDLTLWQFTDLLEGKKYGVESEELDGNYFNGSLQQYYEYFGLDGTVQPPPGTTNPPEEPEIMEAKYDCVARYDVKVRPAPNTANTVTEKILAGTKFQVSEIVADSLDPLNYEKKWGRIFGGQHDGMYTALEYPNNSNPISTYTPITVTPPPPTGEITLTHTIEVYSDGSIKVDGNPV